MMKKNENLSLYFALQVYILQVLIICISRNLGQEYHLGYGLLFPLFPSVAVWLITKYCRYIRVIVLILVQIVCLSELFTLFFNHTPFSVNVVSLIAETDMNETKGFMVSCLTSSSLYYAIGCYVLVSIVLVGVVYCYKKFVTFPSVNKVIRYFMFVLGIVSAGFFVRPYYTINLRFNDPDLAYFITHRDDPPEYYTSITRLLGGMAYVYSSNLSEEIIKKNLLEAEVISCSKQSPLIVLVIGESYNKHHTPLYEPNYLNTTPYLCSLRDSGDLIVYEDVIAPYNHTNEVLHTLFSTCSFEERSSWMNYPLFPALFTKAGYHVYFLSNQFAVQYDDVWNQYSGGIFNKKELSKLQFEYHNRQVYSFDGELLAELPNDSVLSSAPHLIIVHFIGQHVLYKDRCPDSCRVFTSDDYDSPYHQEQIIADYDNSLYYNDQVMKHLVSRFKDKDAVVFYMADHGEECYDWRDGFMRTAEQNIPREVAKYQFEVPFVVYMSPSYRKNHPECSNAICRASQKHLYNTDVKYMLFRMAGLETKYTAGIDVLSDDYLGEQHRIINDVADYDQLIK